MGKNKKTVLAGIAILIGVCALLYIFFFRPSRTGDPAVEETAPESAVYEDPGPEGYIEAIEVDLNDSDGLVRKLAEALSSHPLLLRWLMTDSLIRKFVTAVDLIAKGDSPRRPMDIVELTGAFPVRNSGGEALADPAGYARYDRITGVVASLDTKGCATLYRQLRLPIRQAYEEMGYPGADFDATLQKAIEELLETPVVEGGIYLEKGVLTYLMADPELENLSAAQKHLLRMGPENIRAVQLKLREIARHLRFPVRETGSAE